MKILTDSQAPDQFQKNETPRTFETLEEKYFAEEIELHDPRNAEGGYYSGFGRHSEYDI